MAKFLEYIYIYFNSLRSTITVVPFLTSPFLSPVSSVYLLLLLLIFPPSFGFFRGEGLFSFFFCLFVFLFLSSHQHGLSSCVTFHDVFFFIYLNKMLFFLLLLFCFLRECTRTLRLRTETPALFHYVFLFYVL